MIILAVDLTSEFGSLALRIDDQTTQQVLHSPSGFAHVVFPAIEDLLKSSGVRLDDVSCFASASGPGAFTGVRVGLAAIKGLAEALGRPAVGVSNLRALSTFGQSKSRAVILDARRGDVFAAVYNDGLEATSPEVVTKLSDWLGQLRSQACEIIVQDRALLAGLDVNIVEAPKSLAAAVALCAEIDGSHGRWSDPAALDANYIRRSDAEMFWTDSR
ncbi:MAG: tRNA (adenosine(37)-N6)-threonylcarbamoyltransferase complex dimerization subunit type 1 TsaB [Acidobacteriaceae bacterium]|nr:tRNA (adenosine(37)-N6)-threonylcarbamoyltransferase complex dimerization subunit type 1 TsaB [Acidobacteriaceae bacterium]